MYKCVVCGGEYAVGDSVMSVCLSVSEVCECVCVYGGLSTLCIDK